MVMDVKWCGFDFGQCIMEPGGLRNHLVFGDICKAIGRPDLTKDKIRKYRILREKYETYSSIKEGHRDEIYNFVLDGDPRAIEIYSKKEQEFLDMGDGLVEALEYLQSQGVKLQVVSEMKKTLGPVGTDVVSKFLKSRGLTRFFRELITPQGKIDLVNDTIDPKYKGYTKEAGTIYDVLAQELKDEGIEIAEAVMVGDKPSTDINPAHDRGFRTIQYKGFIDLGPSKADTIVHSFRELKSILRRKE